MMMMMMMRIPIDVTLVGIITDVNNVHLKKTESAKVRVRSKG